MEALKCVHSGFIILGLIPINDISCNVCKKSFPDLNWYKIFYYCIDLKFIYYTQRCCVRVTRYSKVLISPLNISKPCGRIRFINKIYFSKFFAVKFAAEQTTTSASSSFVSLLVSSISVDSSTLSVVEETSSDLSSSMENV